jgi:hypothetical protein
MHAEKTSRGKNKTTAENRRTIIVGAKQASSALPAFDVDFGYGDMANQGKADEAFAWPLQTAQKQNNSRKP